jgi:glutaredoxin
MQIVLYTKLDCPFCVSARNLLNMLSIEYAEVLVGDDKSTYSMSIENYKANIYKSFPGVVIDGKIIGGYTELAQWAVDNHI